MGYLDFDIFVYIHVTPMGSKSYDTNVFITYFVKCSFGKINTSFQIK